MLAPSAAWLDYLILAFVLLTSLAGLLQTVEAHQHWRASRGVAADNTPGWRVLARWLIVVSSLVCTTAAVALLSSREGVRQQLVRTAAVLEWVACYLVAEQLAAICLSYHSTSTIELR